MKKLLSDKQKLEIKWHLFWLRAIVPGVILWLLCYRFLPAAFCPKELFVYMWPVPVVAHYCWTRQCMSPDLKTFIPRIWK
jgi:hypothetical protein